MRLIQEYEKLEHTKGSKKVPADINYSNIGKDLEYIGHQLECAQMNLDNLKVFTEKEDMASLHIIQDVRDEKAARTIAMIMTDG